MSTETEARRSVLVVEDEPLIRMEATDMIEEAGFNVYEVGTADDAIPMLERHGDIAVLFTDVDMPGSMNGLKLAAHVRERWPEVYIIIASGVIDIEKATLPEGCSIYPKPYPTNQIVSELRRIDRPDG